MNKAERIDEQTVSFCGDIYKKSPRGKCVSSNDPEFWDLIDNIDDGNAIIFERDVYLKV